MTTSLASIASAPSGNYIAVAQVAMNPTSDRAGTCQIVVGATTVATQAWDIDSDDGFVNVNVLWVGNVAATSNVSLTCTRTNGMNAGGLYGASSIWAVKLS